MAKTSSFEALLKARGKGAVAIGKAKHGHGAEAYEEIHVTSKMAHVRFPEGKIGSKVCRFTPDVFLMEATLEGAEPRQIYYVLIEQLLGVGGSETILHGDLDVANLVRGGLPIHTLNAYAETTKRNVFDVVDLVGISRRTYARKVKSHADMSPEETDRLVRLARITAAAVLVFKEHYEQWLETPNRALGGVTPFSLLDTDAGATMVEQVIGRAKYGEYS